MKKTIFFILIAFTATLTFESFELGKRRNGTDPGHTGSPGDSLKTCKVCHGGNEEWQPDWISSDIPSTGYIPGNTYTITATNSSPGFNRFGFQVSPQNKKGDLLGTLVVTDFEQTQLVGNNKYITYTSGGVDGKDVKSWTFKWVAPSDTVNEVTFYGAFNSNHDGHKFSDKTTVSNLRVFKNGFTGLNQNLGSEKLISIRQISGEQRIYISTTNLSTALKDIKILNLKGELMYSNTFSTQQNVKETAVSTMGLSDGIYLIQVSNSTSFLTEKLLVRN